jgi:hypothetical protein
MENTAARGERPKREGEGRFYYRQGLLARALRFSRSIDA